MAGPQHKDNETSAENFEGKKGSRPATTHGESITNSSNLASVGDSHIAKQAQVGVSNKAQIATIPSLDQGKDAPPLKLTGHATIEEGKPVTKMELTNDKFAGEKSFQGLGGAVKSDQYVKHDQDPKDPKESKPASHSNNGHHQEADHDDKGDKGDKGHKGHKDDDGRKVANVDQPKAHHSDQDPHYKAPKEPKPEKEQKPEKPEQKLEKQEAQPKPDKEHQQPQKQENKENKQDQPKVEHPKAEKHDSHEKQDKHGEKQEKHDKHSELKIDKPVLPQRLEHLEQKIQKPLQREQHAQQQQPHRPESESTASRLAALLKEAEARLLKPTDKPIFNNVAELQRREREQLLHHQQQQQQQPIRPLIQPPKEDVAKNILINKHQDEPKDRRDLVKDLKELVHKDPKDIKDPRDLKDAKELKDPRGLKDLKNIKDTRDLRDAIRQQIEQAIKNSKLDPKLDAELGAREQPDLVPGGQRPLTPEQIQALIDEEMKRRLLEGGDEFPDWQDGDDEWEEDEDGKPIKRRPEFIEGTIEQQIVTGEVDEEFDGDTDEEDVEHTQRNGQFSLSATATGTQQPQQQQPNAAGAGGGGSSMGADPGSPIDPQTVLPGLNITGGTTGGTTGRQNPQDILAAFFGDKRGGIDRKNMIDQFLARMEDRPQHKIKEGDTLEQIAQVELGDVRLADLIYRLNSARIPTKMIGTRRFQIKLIPHLTLVLPTQEEAQKYLKQIDQMPRRRFEYDKARALLK